MVPVPEAVIDMLLVGIGASSPILPLPASSRIGNTTWIPPIPLTAVCKTHAPIIERQACRGETDKLREALTTRTSFLLWYQEWSIGLPQRGRRTCCRARGQGTGCPSKRRARSRTRDGPWGHWGQRPPRSRRALANSVPAGTASGRGEGLAHPAAARLCRAGRAGSPVTPTLRPASPPGSSSRWGPAAPRCGAAAVATSSSARGWWTRAAGPHSHPRPAPACPGLASGVIARLRRSRPARWHPAGPRSQ